ncbi:MAG: hypothetical protein GF313_00870 [Caldithrix sp.]|nr:hypothetical protein [Caldithrix sp.]
MGFPLDHSISVAIAQTGSVLADLNKNLENHYALIEQAIEQKNDIIIFPELSLTGYSLKDAVYDVAITTKDKKLDQLKKFSQHINIIFGMVELSDRFEIFNSLLFLEDGHLLSKHRKVYLPTYGLFEEKRYFSAGNRLKAFDSKWGRIGLLICEDMWHPTSGIILAQDGATIIFVASAGVARGMDGQKKPGNVTTWEVLNRALGISTTSYIVFANRVGVEDGLMFWGGSEVIDPHGHEMNKAPLFTETLLETKLDLLKLKHARINTRLLSDEKLDVLVDEFNRIKKTTREY